MSVTEVKQAMGSWGLRLRQDTPREILDALTLFGHIAVVPGRLDPKLYGDNLLLQSRYVGVYRGRLNNNDYELTGSGMAFWLGDENGKGDVFETPVLLTAQTFANSVTALLPPGGSITAGVLNSVAGTYTGQHQWQTPRDALNYVTSTFGAEWRVTNEGKLDAGTVAQLYVTSPVALILRKEDGMELGLRGYVGNLQLGTEAREYTTRVVVLGEGEGQSIATGAANAGAVPYKDIHGNTIKQTRLVSEAETNAANAPARAAILLDQWDQLGQSVALDTESYTMHGDFRVGDYLWIFDPDAGFYNNANQVMWKGQPINPVALRCVEMTWPLVSGQTIAFRDVNGIWIDLTSYYVPEGGQTTIVVGQQNGSVLDLTTQPIGTRPMPDTSVPAAPAFTDFSTGSYQSAETNTTKSAIRVVWSTPLNTDGSVVLDGDHYEIRYRASHYLGYGVMWGTLAGYPAPFTDEFTRTTSGWSNGWTDSGGTVPGDYATDGDEATHSLASVNVSRRSTRFSGYVNSTEEITVVIPAVSSGDDQRYGLMPRHVDGSNYYLGEVAFTAAGTYNLRLRKNVAGVFTNFITSASLGTYQAGDRFIIRTDMIADQVLAMVWKEGMPRPTFWTAQWRDSSHASGGLGVRSIVDASWSGGTIVPKYDNYRATEYLAGASGGYRWGALSGSRWGAPLSEPVNADPKWLTAFFGWGTNEGTLTELTPGMTYELQIRGVDAANPPKSGPWSASSFVTTIGDLFPPAQPAAPEVAGSTVAIQVTHRLGRNTGGEYNLETDLDHLEVHVGGSPEFYPDDGSQVGRIPASAANIGAHIPVIGTFPVRASDQVWVKVVAVDRSGNKSAGSPAATVSAILIDNAHISDLSVSKLTAGTITAQSILAAMLTVGSGGIVSLTEGRVEVKNADGRVIMEIGKRSDGLYGMLVNDDNGVPQVLAGELTDGDYGLAAVNAVGQLVKLSTLAFGIVADEVTTIENCTSLTFDDLATPGPICDGVVIGDTGRCLVICGALLQEGSTLPAKRGGSMSFEVSGATTVAATFENGLRLKHSDDGVQNGAGTISSNNFNINVSNTTLLTGLNPGIHRFIAKYECGNGNVVTFGFRQLVVIPF